MKKLASICYGLFLGTVLLYPQQIKYKTIEDTIMSEDGDIYVGIPLEKQGKPVRKDSDVVYSMGNYFVFSDLKEYGYSVIFAETDEEPAGYFILDSLEREGISHEIHSVINGTWITAYTYDILYANSKDQITKYEPYWGIETEYSRFDRDSWEDVISPTKLIMTDNSFYIYSSDRNWRDFLFVSEKEENGHFFIEVYTRGKNNPYYYDEGNFIARFTEPKKKGFYIEMDGGYLKLFEDGLDVKPLTILARTDDYEGITEKLRAIARGEKADLSDVTWPRHADGSCEYEDENGNLKTGASANLAAPVVAAIPKPAPAIGKTAVVTENLRLRTDDTAAAAEVVATLAAGTRVQVHLLGKEDTIDGITSKWVQVSPVRNSVDANGQKVHYIVGWCFGGYLKEVAKAANAPTTERAEPSEEAAISKPAPTMGKTAIVTENLRLRTDDKTAAEVVTTLATGTRVKVLAPGREDTIDGIKSNWVQASVFDGAKDKDGNAIEAGTVGWLFGGYLSEAKSVESERANEEAVAAKESSALPIVPIAAGGAALIILLAVVLLAVKKSDKLYDTDTKKFITNNGKGESDLVNPFDHNEHRRFK